MAGLKPVWTLVAHDLRRRLRSLVIWGVALGALGALYVALYPSMSALLEEYMKGASEAMRQYMGGLEGSITIEAWLEMEFVGSIIPIALPFMAMLIGARTIAGGEERKTLDLLLSNPLPRWQVVAGAIGTIAISLAGVLALTWALTYVAVPFAGVDLGPGRLAAALAALWPFCLFFGALALLLSALLRRGALATAVPAVVLVAMYVIEGLGQAVKAMDPLRVVSLFHHLGHPLEGDFPWTAALLTLVAVCVLAGGAVVAFNRRDVYT